MGTKNSTSTQNGTSSGTSTTNYSPQVQAAYNALLSQLQGNSSGTNAATTNATTGAANLANSTNSNYANAANTLNSATTPASQTVQSYLSPYVQSQLQSQIALENQQNAQQQQGVVGNAAAQGALGGNRVAVAQSQLAGQQALANNATNAGLLNTAYQQALSGALQGQQNETAVGTAQSNLGSQETNTTLQSLLAELEGGNSQFSNLGTLSGAASGLSGSGATTTSSGTTSGTTTVPNGNFLSQLVGLGTSIAGLFASGGVVPGYAYGGDTGAEEREAGLQGVLNNSQQATQQLMQATQAAQQQNSTAPTFSNERQQGVQNIKGWLSGAPSVSARGANSWAAPYYGAARGGVIRGYDDGGLVANDDDLLPDDDQRMVANSGVVNSLYDLQPMATPIGPLSETMKLPQGVVKPATLALPAITPSGGPNLGSAANAIRSMESGSPGGDYGAVGPVTRTGDRAYGAYQVMGANVPSWTAEYYGKSLTPQQFLNNPAAQDAVFQGQFGSYANKYGPEGAAKAWFAGEGGMNNPNASDVNGTTVADYARRFDNGSGVVPANSNQNWQSVLASDAGFGRPVAPNGQVIADNGQGFNPSKQTSPTIGSVISNLLQGKGTGLNDDQRAALISAGLGIMGGTNANALVNIGQGAQKGFQTYNDLQKINMENAAKQAEIARQAAETQNIRMQAARQGTQFQQNGLGFNETVVNPDGSISIQRIPYSAVPTAGTPSAPASGSPAAPAPTSADVPDFSPQDFPTQVNTNEGLQALQTQGQSQFLEPAVREASTAHQVDASLGQLAALAAKLPTTGPLTQGAGFNDRVGWASAANTALQALGAKGVIDPNELATAEGVKKISTQLQAALADAWKSDPAASTIALASSGSPSGENTRLGLSDIIGNITALNRRAEDRANYFNKWSGKNYGIMNGFPQGSADDYFNAAHPPQVYIDAGKVIGGSLAGSPVKVTNSSVYDELPSGTVYIGPDGNVRKKQ